MSASSQQKPLVFLAFANDRSDYLYNLKVELENIRKALQPAIEKGLCDLIVETNVTLGTIFDTFQKHRNRISVFHYGGHADAYKMLLETESGGKALTHSSGLSEFLGNQKGLQLIFINGCSSEKQALELKEAGVPLVIGTTQPIIDAVATDLSQRFYESLAYGLPIGQAWEEAQDQVQQSKGDHSYRSLELEDEAYEEVELSSFPWRLNMRPGSEKALDWNLPEAARQPLFDLPLPNKYYEQLPPEPFKGLHYFQQKDAAVFFGRGVQIRDLYNQLNRPESLILFYGKSGAGKSSLLDAGLLPRLEGSWEVEYQRRDPETGLSASLREGLVRHATEAGISELDTTPLAEIWQQIEANTSKPLLFILDQAEECFTRPLPKEKQVEPELAGLLADLGNLFHPDGPKLMGKLILAYRKEYHPEIKQSFQEVQIPTSELFLQHLNRQGIIEVVEGLVKDPRTKDAYRLTIQEEAGGSLAEIIADDLLEDKDSPVAAMLQILLTKLWRVAKEENSALPVFSVQKYQALKKEGLAMNEFFEQQMAKLTDWQAQLVESGLVLDVLEYHTTPLRTAGTRTLEEIRETYQQRQEVINELLTKCKELYLLTTPPDQPGKTSLAHDTLAPVVLDRFNHSDLPAQRAQRILNNKLKDFEAGKESTFLDAADLAVLEQGIAGMRHLRQQAQDLLAESRKLQAKRERIRKRNRILLFALSGIIGLFGIFGWNQYAQTKKSELVTVERMIRASWKAGTFLQRNPGWVEGVRKLYDGIRPIMNLEKLSELAPMDIFESGPHGIEPNYSAEDDFAHYNKDFVIWLENYGIPGSKDPVFRRETQKVYDDFLQEMSRAYFKVYYYINSHPNLDIYAAEYQQIVNDGGSTANVSFNEDFFDPGPLGETYIPNGAGDYLFWRFYAFAQQFSKDPANGTLGYYFADTACGFWLRRHIDGTDEEFHKLLVILLQTYDPEFLVTYQYKKEEEEKDDALSVQPEYTPEDYDSTY